VRKNATAWTFKRTLEREEWMERMKGDAAIIWRQAGREGKRDDCMQGRRETLLR